MLPEDVVLADPWLTYWRGAAKVWSDPQAAYLDFEHARALFEEFSNEEGRLRAIMSLLESIDLTLSDVRGKDRWIFELLRLLQPALPIETNPIRLRGWATLLASMLDRMPGHSAIGQAVPVLLLALDTSSLAPDLRLQIGWVVLYYGFEAADGNLARRALRGARGLPENPACSPSARCLWWNSEGWYHFAYGDWTSAMRSFEQMSDVAREFKIESFELLGRTSATMMRTIGGDLVTADQECATLLALTDDRQYQATRILLKCQAMLKWYRGDLAQALKLIDAAIKAVDDLGLADLSSCTRVDMSAICMDAGDHARAAALLNQASHCIEETLVRYLDGAIEALRAVLVMQAGDKSLAIKAVLRCMEVLENPCTRGSFAVLANTAAVVCHEAIVNGIHPDLACELITTLKLRPCVGATVAWPWPVKIRSLGTFEVNLTDGPMEAGGRTPYKVLEMLKRLLSAGPKGLSGALLADMLWPDAEGDSAQISLRTTIHRLRRLLICEGALKTQNGRVALDRQFCWIDAFEFESVPADVADPAQATRAIALYGGPFMPDENDGNIVNHRERLQAKYLRLVTTSARYHESAGDWQAAARVYAQALEADAANDVLFMRLIKCLRETGDQDSLRDWRQRRMRLAQTGLVPMSQELEDFLSSASSRQ
jgi:DNA-binding SARP family transcriptional activator